MSETKQKTLNQYLIGLIAFSIGATITYYILTLLFSIEFNLLILLAIIFVNGLYDYYKEIYKLKTKKD